MITRLALAVLLALASPARAAPSPEEAGEAVDRHLALFLALPDRREHDEGVRVFRDRLEIWFLRPVRRADRDDAACDAARWLLAGRLARADGIGALFAALPDVREVALVFYGVETHVEPDAKGRYTQQRNATPHARVTITRDKAALLDPKGVRALLQGPGCTDRAKDLLDVFWVR
jgi:hypothetical protein